MIAQNIGLFLEITDINR